MHYSVTRTLGSAFKSLSSVTGTLSGISRFQGSLQLVLLELLMASLGVIVVSPELWVVSKSPSNVTGTPSGIFRCQSSLSKSSSSVTGPFRDLHCWSCLVRRVALVCTFSSFLPLAKLLVTS